MKNTSKVLTSLYNGINNDHSIQRYTLGWKDIVKSIEKRYKTIPKTEEQFQDKLVVNAIGVTKGGLKSSIECFARELSLNLETLRQKN